MKTPVFTGANVAIVTPFTEKGVNYEKLGELIEFQIEKGIDAITVCGTTGESPTLTHEEHCAVIEYSVKKVAGRIPVIAGSGSNDTSYAVELSHLPVVIDPSHATGKARLVPSMAMAAAAAGADGLLMVTPYYNKTTQRGLIQHYSYVADRVNTPIILYNVPSRTGVGFTADTYAELSKHPNINGIKEASGDFSLIAETLSKCGDNMFIWSGNDDQVVPLMSLGAKGVISVTANIFPDAVSRMCKCCLDGDFKTATELQLKYLDITNALFKEVNPIPVKAAMKLLGMDNGYLRMPLCEMSPSNLEVLRKSLENIGANVAK